MGDFIHLHNHSDYSLLDAAQTVERMCNRVYDLGMDSIAITEHGNLFSMILMIALVRWSTSYHLVRAAAGLPPARKSLISYYVFNDSDECPRTMEYELPFGPGCGRAPSGSKIVR